MGRRERRDKGRAGPLDIELTVGCLWRCPHLVRCEDEFGCGQSAYESEVDREAAWWKHRSRLMRDRQGTRPWGWWRYEAPAACVHDPSCPLPAGGRDRSVRQVSWLAAHGLLEPRERALLLRGDGTVPTAVRDAVRTAERSRK
jgi:hypothetical protein